MEKPCREWVVILDMMFGGVLFIKDGKWFPKQWSTNLCGFSLSKFGLHVVYRMDGRILVLLAGSDRKRWKFIINVFVVKF